MLPNPGVTTVLLVPSSRCGTCPLRAVSSCSGLGVAVSPTWPGPPMAARCWQPPPQLCSGELLIHTPKNLDLDPKSPPCSRSCCGDRAGSGWVLELDIVDSRSSRIGANSQEFCSLNPISCRVWEAQMWTCERWPTIRGRCQVGWDVPHPGNHLDWKSPLGPPSPTPGPVKATSDLCPQVSHPRGF